MMGVLFIWSDLGFGTPSLDTWHYLYKTSPIKLHPQYYFFSRWPKGREALVKPPSSSAGGWRERFFFIDVATGGPGLREEFSDAKFIPRPQLSETELAQVEAAFALEDRSWAMISKDRRVSAMGKFNVKSDKEHLKAASKSRKEEVGKSSGSSSKRKEPEVGRPSKPKPSKKIRIDVDPKEAEANKKKPSSGSVIVGLPAEGAAPVERPEGAIPERLRVKEFLSEASKAFLKPSFDGSTTPGSSRDKLQLSFHRIVSGLYAQFDAMTSLDSAEGPLKEKIVKLESQLNETEAKLENANRIFLKMKASNAELREALTRSKDARQDMSTEIAEAEERYELEIGKLQNQVLELQGLVARQCEEIEKLKVGEGLDLDAFIDSEAFAGVKDAIEDATGDDLIRRINEVHPDLDLTFLTAVEPSSSPVKDVERNTGGESKAADEEGSA